MKVKALIGFKDLQEGVFREKGEEFEVKKARYAELSNTPRWGALVEEVKEEKKQGKD